MDSLVDLADVRRLIAIVQKHGLESLSVTDGDVEVGIVAAPAAEGDDTANANARGGALSVTSPAGETSAAVVGGARPGLLTLKSPITGVFYRSPHPSDPEFIQVGDVVSPDDPVCIIEAMKIFNEIPAGLNGRLVRVVAANEQLVVTGETLMEFEPADDATGAGDSVGEVSE